MKFPIFFTLLAFVSAENVASSYKTSEDAKKPGYNFESSYDNNSRSESRHGKVTTGSYRVPLPDGRVQVVNYRADENGYVADVKYEGEAKYPEYKPASSYSAPAYKAETVPVYEVVTTAKPTYKIPTTPAPTTTTPDSKAPAYVEASYIAPATTAASIDDDRSYPDPEFKALYRIATTTPAPTTTPPAYVAHADVEYKVTDYSAPAYQTPVSHAYGIRYVGDVKQYEDRNNYLETKVNSSPAYKSTFFVFPKYKVSSLDAAVHEKPEMPDYRTSFHSALVAPLPLAYRARYAIKASNKIVDQDADSKDSPYVAPKVTSVYTPVYYARTTTTLAYKDLTTAAPTYNVPITTTAAPVYFASSYKAPEYVVSTTSNPAYKPSTFFTSNKESISSGYKELSRIFRETSLTAGNKNWDNFFNKAWEFARTKY